MDPAAAFQEAGQVAEGISPFYAFQHHTLDPFAGPDKGVLCGEGLDRLHLFRVAEGAHHRIVPVDRQFFGDRVVVGGKMLYADMSPEIEDLLADGILESVGKGKGQQHGGYADHGCRDRQPDDKAGKGPLPVKSDASGYKGVYIQTA